MRILFIMTAVLLAACSQTKNEQANSTESDKPNIVFIFTDDQTYTSISSLGNTEIQTPNIDRLVNNGTTFTHAYNMGAWNGAVCVASRAMLISGRSVWHANQFRKQWLNGAAIDQTWGKLMEQNGYTTYMSGKWHVDAPADKVFGTARNVRPGMPHDAWEHQEMVDKFDSLRRAGQYNPADIMPVGYNRPKDEQDNSWSPVDPQFGGFWEGGKHWSEVLKDDAVGFINTAKAEKDPFFMYLAFNAPHDPRQSPQEFIDKYPLENLSLPESWMAEYPWKDSIGNGRDLRDEALAPFPRTPYATKKHIQEYYAAITHLDEQIGVILDALQASGKMDNTYVFFTSDHGLAMGRHGLLGKQSLYDHSIRVPLMVMGPDIPKDKKVDADVYLQDVMATSLELAGVDKPDYVEFNSLLQLAKGETTESAYDAIYGCYINYQRMIRKEGYKLILYPKAGKQLLFDLENDPDEIQDLSENPQYHDKMVSLFNSLTQLQSQMNDTLDLAQYFPAN
ncbi:sulfatase-like hydrolase/transferase [Fulvivirgaceae bacterium BMA12]|uniref:Sulfatase-like hydrolase/transferase n=1 Tax=Agaribacillus aureus TaxID=3051825 RepID=A0ABT8L290_9BACT|nr:sulfatase-like hydrolase/transferase [Fulvivirgaceae bacterium BMA12]